MTVSSPLRIKLKLNARLSRLSMADDLEAEDRKAADVSANGFSY